MHLFSLIKVGSGKIVIYKKIMELLLLLLKKNSVMYSNFSTEKIIHLVAIPENWKNINKLPKEKVYTLGILLYSILTVPL